MSNLRIPVLLLIASILSACGLEPIGQVPLGDNMTMPDSRDLTLTPNDPLPSAIVNRLQDGNVVGSHELRPNFVGPFDGVVDFVGTATADPGLGLVLEGNNQVVYSLPVHQGEVVSLVRIKAKVGEDGSVLQTSLSSYNPDASGGGGGLQAHGFNNSAPGSPGTPPNARTLDIILDPPFAPAEDGFRFLSLRVTHVPGVGANLSSHIRGIEVWSKVPID